jgi:hypothetical protein
MEINVRFILAVVASAVIALFCPRVGLLCSGGRLLEGFIALSSAGGIYCLVARDAWKLASTFNFRHLGSYTTVESCYRYCLPCTVRFPPPLALD